MEDRWNCILIEDEALGIEMLQDYIGRRNDLVLIGTAVQRSEIKSLLKICSPSIIFLDLIIPNGERNDVKFSKLPKDSVYIIISATPLSHFSGDKPLGKTYELLKPISYENFNKCIDIVISNIVNINAQKS